MSLVFIASLLVAYSTVRWGLFELKGVIYHDALIFLTVGRGILNGLTPYLDLFETKPPGIFLLSAVSLSFTGDVGFAKVVQAIAILGLPFCVIIPAFRETKDVPKERRIILLLLSFLFGGSLALYTGQMAGKMLSESYGAFFGAVYLAVVIGNEQSLNWKRILVASLFLLLSIGMKEPFLLSVFAASLLLAPSLPSLRRSFLFPLGIAAVAGVLVMLLLGYLVPYLTIYMPHMLGFHITQLDAAVWLRAFAFSRIYENLTAFSPWFAWSIIVLWCATLVCLLDAARTLRERQYALVLWFVVTYLTMLAVGIGGDFYGHHFVFAVPTYIAFFFVCLRRWVKGPKSFFPSVLISLFVILLLIYGIFSRPDISLNMRTWEREKATMQAIAATVDGVMDRCGMDRYLQLEDKGGGPFGYTKHSPYGPIFIHHNRFMEGNPFYAKSFARQFLEEAPIIFFTELKNTNLTDKGRIAVQLLYSPIPWSCAEPFEQPELYKIWFRKQDKSE